MRDSIGWTADTDLLADFESEHPLDAIRAVLTPELAELDDESLGLALIDAYGEEGAQELVEFFGQFGRAVSRFARAAAPVIQRRLPGVIQGATAGATMGGPYGALLGGLLGGLRAPPSRSPRPRPPRAAPAPAPPAAPGASPGTPGPGTPTGSASAGQLLALLQRPEIMQALLAMLMGQAGRRQVRLGRESVPVNAVTSAIAELATRATEEHNASLHRMDATPSYLLDDSGAPLCDAASPGERAGVLVDLAWRATEADLDASDDADPLGWSSALEEDDWDDDVVDDEDDLWDDDAPTFADDPDDEIAWMFDEGPESADTVADDDGEPYGDWIDDNAPEDDWLSEVDDDSVPGWSEA